MARITMPQRSRQRVEEGAAAHCHPDDFPLLHRVLFDCVDETFV